MFSERAEFGNMESSMESSVFSLPHSSIELPTIAACKPTSVNRRLRHPFEYERCRRQETPFKIREALTHQFVQMSTGKKQRTMIQQLRAGRKRTEPH